MTEGVTHLTILYISEIPLILFDSEFEDVDWKYEQGKYLNAQLKFVQELFSK